MKNDIKSKAIIVALLITSSHANANGSILGLLQNGVGLMLAFKAFMIVLSAAVGIWQFFSGVINLTAPSNGQANPGMAVGKIFGGLVLMSLMAWASAILNEVGIEQTQNSALFTGVN